MNILTHDELSQKLGITKKALHSLRNREPSFPKPIRMSEKVLRWDEADINQWLESKKERTE